MCRDSQVQRSSIALIGFSDGHIRGYSKSGCAVFSEQLHLDAVSKISSMLPSPNLMEQSYQVLTALLLLLMQC